MASLNNGDIDWLWGSLKPWQILHSTLAEKERCGSVQLDVWELVHETLGASTTDLATREEGDGGRSHGMQFLGDDGDFWRPGGVMECRVREWLARKNEEDEISQLSAALCTEHLQLAIASTPIDDHCSAAISIAWEAAPAAADFDLNSCSDDQDDEDYGDQAAAEDYGDQAVAEDDDEDGDQAAAEDEEDGADHLQDDTEDEDDEENQDYYSLNYTQIIRRDDNHSLISSNHHLNYDYSEISREFLVLNHCCTTSAAAAAAAGGDLEAGRKTAKLAERMAAPPDLEEAESIEVCAVCLEKLTQYYEEGGVQALACRHAFHTVCISPWLQRQAHACCPCCRAPISTANLAPPLHLEAPLDLEAGGDADGFACAGHHDHGEEQRQERATSNDIMGLLADMEAALERLGFRS